MKHFISILIIAIAISSIAKAQECKVPISVQLSKYISDTQYNRQDKLGASFMDFLEHRGFTTEVHNTRVAISLITSTSNDTCNESIGKMDVEIKFIDVISGTEFYSTKLSKSYCGNYYATRDELARDFASSIPELDSLVDSIHTCIIDAFDVNTKHMAEIGYEYAAQGDHKVSLFALVQYPTCCRNYPKIRDFMVAVFRDYMKKNHDALLDLAKSIYKNGETDVEARFAVALLNSVTFDKSEQKKANKLLKKIAKDYPSLDLTAKEEYTFVPELKEIAVREARSIGIEYSTSDDDTSDEKYTKTKNFIPSVRHRYQKYRYDYDYDSDSNFNTWFPIMMSTYMQL